ncbi:TPA: autotransporter outer membrane beta-barrel domain-containing protein, partial [Klebsiella pneumoniae]|nr:autotransporter outer membrane beta-barrel domain-containing protein [Klebsiella pneumoniae]
LKTSVIAEKSSVTLGDSRVFIDNNDGGGTRFKLLEGVSVATTDSDKSFFIGQIQAKDSTVNVSSGSATLLQTELHNTPLNLQGKSDITATKNFVSDGNVNIYDASFSLNTHKNTDGAVPAPAFYSAANWSLDGESSLLKVGPWSMLTGDVSISGKGSVDIGGEGHLSNNLSMGEKMLLSLFNGYRNVWEGTLTAARESQVSMQDTRWSVTGNSTAGKLSMNRSIAGFSGERSSFFTLKTDYLNATDSALVLRSDLKQSDKVVINKEASGKNNTLWVDFLKKPDRNGTLDIPLVDAPAATDSDMFSAASRSVGFSDVTPSISVREQEDGRKMWILDGYSVSRNADAGKAASSFMSIGYSSFMAEVNNLNKRMGELRDSPANVGSWARIMNGSGSAEGGYSDNYTHLQIGADKKHTYENMELFTGITMTYTDSKATGNNYKGETKSWGAGLYASGLFSSGFYFDTIAKYVHHENDYELNFAGAGKRHAGNHSLYAGGEIGYRYHLSKSLFVEPQAELVWGRIQGQKFSWKDGNMDVSMQRGGTNPLVGRTGVVSGKTFSGKDWSLTARAGLHYEFDMKEGADIHLRDGAGEHLVKGGKDARMLYNAGINVRSGENIRFGLELERSAFGKTYNTDHAVNATFRYSF